MDTSELDATTRHIAFITAVRESAGIGAGTAIADIPAAVAALRASERAAGREEAAKVAETKWQTVAGRMDQHRERQEHGERIASAIRAIGEKP